MHSSDDDMNDKDGRAEEDADADELQVDDETPHPLTDKVSSKNDGPITHLSSIWDCKHIEKLGVKGGTEGQDKERWRCRHCCTEFTKWNTSKAMYHSAKISGHFIRPCPTKIPSNLLDSYRALVRRGQKNKTAIALSKKEHQEKISSRLQKNSRILQDRGGRMPKKSKSSMPEPNTPHTPHVAIAGQDVTVDEDDDQYVECCGTNRSCQPNHSVSFEKVSLLISQCNQFPIIQFFGRCSQQHVVGNLHLFQSSINSVYASSRIIFASSSSPLSSNTICIPWPKRPLLFHSTL